MANKIEEFKSLVTPDVDAGFEAQTKVGALNLGLRMAKHVRYGRDSNNKYVFNPFRGKGAAEGSGFSDQKFDRVPFSEFTARQKALASAYATYIHLTVEQPENARFVIGMGEASVYGNGFTLHPVFGCPFLPGSSLKGITRRTYIDEYHDGSEVAALADQTFCDLFGCTGLTRLEKLDANGNVVRKQNGKPETYDAVCHYLRVAREQGSRDPGDRRGALIFFDALPTRAPKVVVDILTPHYAPYYKDALPPADIYNPIPVQFLAVEDGEFEVVLALDPSRGLVADAKDIAVGEEVDGFARAAHALKLALTEDGIGGKTTVGYGRFKITGESFRTDDPRAKAREEARQIAETKAQERAAEEAAQRERERLTEEERIRQEKLAQRRVSMTIDAANLQDGREIFADVVKFSAGVVSVKPLITNLQGQTEFSFKYPAGIPIGQTVTVAIRVQNTKKGKQIQSVQFVRIPE